MYEKRKEKWNNKLHSVCQLKPKYPAAFAYSEFPIASDAR